MAETRVIFGFHAVISRLRQNPERVREVYLSDSRHDRRIQDLLLSLESKKIRVMQADNKRLEGLAGSNRHQGVVAIVENPRAELDDVLENLPPDATLLALDGVTDPHNLGACLRVADALGVSAVIAPKDRAVGITPIVSKVASGAAESVPYVMVTNLSRTLQEFKECDIWVIGADSEATEDIYSLKISGRVAWVLGAEGSGLRRLTRESCDQLVRIPMTGSVESLNVSVSCGICLYETIRQRKLP